MAPDTPFPMGADRPMYDAPMFTPVEVQRGPAAIGRAGSLVLIGAALSVAVHAWLARGAFVPIAGNAGIEYVFVSATAGTFVEIFLIVTALVFVAHLLVRRLATPREVRPAPFSSEDVAYARPLFCFASSLLPLLNLVRPLAGFRAR